MHLENDLVEEWLEQLSSTDHSQMGGRPQAAGDVDPHLVLQTREALVAFAATSAPPVRPARELRDRILASLEDGNRFQAHVDRLSVFLDLPPERVRDLLRMATTVGADAPGWRDTGLPGLLVLPFRGGPNIAGAQAQLLHLNPGFEFPAHRHGGPEWGYVLQGLLLEDSGHQFATGDVVHQRSGSRHCFTVTSDCPALLFVLLEGPIQWLDD